MKKKNLTVLWTMLLLLTSCTILDNDLRGLPDTPGFKDVVHEETDLYTASYQYTPEVTLVDENLLAYVARIDTAYTTLLLYDYVPEDLRPEAGDLLVAAASDKIPYGLGHRVTAVERLEHFYACQLKRAAVGDIFKTISLESNLEADSDNSDHSENSDDSDNSDTSAKPLRVRRRASLDKTITKNLGQYAKVEFKSDGTATSAQGKGGLTVEGKMAGKVSARIGPEFTLNIHYDKPDGGEEEYDINAAMKFVMADTISLEGTASFEYDIIKSLGIQIPAIGPIGPPGLMFYITITPTIGFGGSISGKAEFSIRKECGFGAGFRKNMTQADGGYLLDIPDKPLAWGGGVDAEAGLEVGAHLTGGINLDIGINSPKAGCFIGVEFQPGLSTSLTTSSKGAYDPYDQKLKFSVPITPKAGLYANLLFGGEYRWDIVDALKKKFNFSAIPFEPKAWTKEWRFYPSLDNFSVFCMNRGNLSEPPSFTVMFENKDYGVMTPTKREVYPKLQIIDRDTQKEVTNHIFYALDKDKPELQSWDFGGTETFVHDRVYIAKTTMMVHTPGYDYALWEKTGNFTAVSPSAIISNWKLLKCDMKSVSSGNRNKVITYTFTTDVTLNGDKDVIHKWGVKMGSKKYEIPSDYWKPGKYKIKWTATKNTGTMYEVDAKERSGRTLNFDLYIIDDLGMQLNPTSQTIYLEWQDGLDEEYQSESGMEDVDMSGKKLTPPPSTLHTSPSTLHTDDGDLELEIISVDAE